MKKSRWMHVVAFGSMIALMASGCRSWSRGRSEAGGGPGGTVPVVEPAFTDQDIGLPGERFEGTEMATKFDPVYFDYDSSHVKPSEQPKIEKVAEYLRANPSLRLIIEGHCDERGSAEYNLALGERRALAIRAYLVGLGVDASRIQTISYGEERPAAPGTGESVWRLNRRGEFVIVQ